MQNLLNIYEPQVLRRRVYSLRDAYHSTLQIKNIKLHIVTDIKVTINSLSIFGFRYLVGGRVIFTTKEKMRCVPFQWYYDHILSTPQTQWSDSGGPMKNSYDDIFFESDEDSTFFQWIFFHLILKVDIEAFDRKGLKIQFLIKKDIYLFFYSILSCATSFLKRIGTESSSLAATSILT